MLEKLTLYSPIFRFPCRKPTGAKLALKPSQVWRIRVRLQVGDRFRDLALFDLALDSKLRACDLIQLRVSDLLFASGVKRRVVILQQETGRPVQFEVTEQARRSIAAWIEAKELGDGDWLFPNRMKRGGHVSTRPYTRLVDKWVALVGVDPAAFGTHSLRRAKVALLLKKTGNLRACQLLLGHTKLENGHSPAWYFRRGRRATLPVLLYIIEPCVQLRLN